MNKILEESYEIRENRVMDTIQLKVPDRVPVIVHWGYFPAKYAGISCEAAFYDIDKWQSAYRKTIPEFDPDMCFLQNFFPGEVLEALDFKPMKWPGHGVSSDHGHQYIEGEHMKEDEYPAFLEDLSDFVIRSYLPRVYGALEPLKKLPPLWSTLLGYGEMAGFASLLVEPEFEGALEALINAGNAFLKYRSKMRMIGNELEEMGYPLYSRIGSSAPFDTISDFFRGMRGSMLDLFRQPDNILAACEKLLPIRINKVKNAAKITKNPRVFIPLHRGADGFMSLDHFETFYWPTLKKLLLAIVDEGLIPCIFIEGDYTSRLEYLLELPKGKVLCHFDTTDIFRAKEVIGGHLCIRGNVPSSLLQVASASEVEEYCKKLIKEIGKGGGFILSPRSSIDEAKPENVKVMIDSVRKYGQY